MEDMASATRTKLQYREMLWWRVGTEGRGSGSAASVVDNGDDGNALFWIWNYIFRIRPFCKFQDRSKLLNMSRSTVGSLKLQFSLLSYTRNFLVVRYAV
jgi:hypothetical protein